MIVVDASLATKWFVGEHDQDLAITFLDDFDRAICAPDLLLTEVGGAIVRRANSDKGFVDDARLALDRMMLFWDHGGIVLQRLTSERVARAAKVALELGHPLADCVYLTLAIELDYDLATCDAKFHAKAAPRYPRTRMLADYTH